MRTNAPEMLGNLMEACYEGLSLTGKNMLLMKRLLRDYIAPAVYAQLSWAALRDSKIWKDDGG